MFLLSDFFLDPEHLENFEKYLKSINCSEEICLLTTFAQMAQAKRADVDEDFIRIVVLEIYEVRNFTGPFRKRMNVLSSFLAVEGVKRVWLLYFVLLWNQEGATSEVYNLVLN